MLIFGIAAAPYDAQLNRVEHATLQRHPWRVANDNRHHEASLVAGTGENGRVEHGFPHNGAINNRL